MRYASQSLLGHSCHPACVAPNNGVMGTQYLTILSVILFVSIKYS